MDYKVNYLSTINEKVCKKHYESYVINALWFWIDNPDVHFVTQQYVQRTENKNNALIDLYLPQINLAVEIDETQHKLSIMEDKQREDEIRKVIPGVEIVRIKVYNDKKQGCPLLTIDQLNKQIKEVAQDIKSKISCLGSKFEPWKGEDEFLVSNIKKRGVIVSEGYNQTCVNTIDDAFDLFGAKPKHKGFLRAGGADDPSHPDQLIWCPNVKNAIWANVVNSDETQIDEYPRKDDPMIHLNNTIQSGRTKRIVFLKSKDMLGNSRYRFVGVFQLDRQHSQAAKHCVWIKIASKYNL